MIEIKELEGYGDSITMTIDLGLDGENQLEDYYLAKNGIWRDPESGDLFLRVPDRDDITDGAAVLQMTQLGKGYGKIFWEGWDEVHSDGVARYFEHNGGAPNKPWHFAKAEELWEILFEDWTTVSALVSDQEEFIYTDHGFGAVMCKLTDKRIVRGKRLWPPVDGS